MKAILLFLLFKNLNSMKNFNLFILICTFSSISCKTQNSAVSNIEKNNQQTIINSSQDLTSRLRSFSGVQIQGNGANASIVIRSVNSFMLSSEPLFIIDGVQFSGSYSVLYNSISSNDIKKIEVLKDGGSLAMYGSNGANGVIKILTRK